MIEVVLYVGDEDICSRASCGCVAAVIALSWLELSG